MADLTGAELDDYRVLRRLGTGGMAEVYLAEQKSLGRQVALKVLLGQLASDAVYVQRFTNEARAVAALIHPNIVQIYEVGHADGVHYIAQEYVAGKNLAQLQARQGSLAPQLVLDVLRQVAAALGRAAEQGIVHRDIKPENLLLNASGEVKVADFGLARVLNENSKTLTQVGVAMGTPLYMSPEQIEGRHVDVRSDLYSLGVTAYHLLAGRPPHTGDTALAIAVQHLNVEPKPLQEMCKGAPRGLVRIVHRLMSKQPDRRYESPAELLADLRTVALQAAEDGWGDGPEHWPAEGGLAAWISEHPSPSHAQASPSQATRVLNDVMHAEAEFHRNRWKRRRTAVILLGALLFGACLAFLTRPRSYLSGVQQPLVKPRESAWAQIYQANRAPSESAWLSVEQNFPRADPYLHSLADQGLVRYYLLLSDENEKALVPLKKLTEASAQEDASESLQAFTYAATAIAQQRLGNDAAAREAVARLTTPLRDDLRQSEPRLYELLVKTQRALGE